MNSLYEGVNNDVSLTQNEISRLIGSIEGSEEGPLVIMLAGIHGNEQAGVSALEHVFDLLSTLRPVFKGRFYGIRANIAALKLQVRYIDEDMNRIWFPSIIDEIRNTPTEQIQSSERAEIKEVLDILDEFLAGEPGFPAIIGDLHSFSAEGCMFAITAQKDAHIELFSSVHVPLIFGIENTLQGTALRYYQDLGHITFALEGGQHENKLTPYNITSALFLLLKEAGCLREGNISSIMEYDKHLSDQTLHIPEQVELVYQHIIEPGDGFEMRPGFSNFQLLKKGEWLASDKDGKINAQCDGYLLMPLYQSQGNDGFFIVQEQQS